VRLLDCAAAAPCESLRVGKLRDGPPLERPREGVRRALILSGGGARGAYEAGVLSYLFEELPQRLGYVPRLDIVCGTSVGAVNACHVAAFAHDPAAGAERLAQVWRQLSFGHVYQFGLKDAAVFARTLLGFAWGTPLHGEAETARIHGLLNTTPLEQLVVQQIPWRQLRRNLRAGLIQSLCVATTEVSSGLTVIFVDNRANAIPTWTRDQLIVARAARVGPQHALASAAIPFLFPAVRLGSGFYCDGGLRQHSPLSPALRLGANRVLAVGVRFTRTAQVGEPLAEQRIEQFRSASFLLGKVLNTLLADRLEIDLGHMRVINRMLAAGVETGDPSFLRRVNDGVEKERGLGFQIVEDCLIRPSEDLSAIAARHTLRMREHPPASWLGRATLRMLDRGTPSGESDLMSYLLFDGEYTSELVALGRADAAAREEELLRFFNV
jgi:NTE family protein